ncbi:hypothetical protein [Desertibacillus haloalkaliphilus]|uniref:hypothetical protein n=1 Tax=Desertibacillus haloalkaliphilus TaxID=1328930 RepID=UPI001C25A3E0|nr:hypothetical protein [Desertibacillus haloalkaliphilus]MBU8908530.1 hypothetical protein [Desertibacillus haloalkaliphilus]
MEFYAIAYKYQEDVFVDFSKREDVMDLESTCLLPTKAMAEQYIEDELSDDYVTVSIEIETINRSGVWSWSRGLVGLWDDHEEIDV